MLVAEGDVAMDEIADRLDARPPRWRLFEEVPGHLGQALGLTTKLVPGVPRGAVGTPGANQAPRNTDNDIWAADLHLTANGRFLYASERTTNTIGALRIDSASGKLIYVGSTPTEKQPRGFNIDPTGQFIVVSGEKSDMLAVYSTDSESGT